MGREVEAPGGALLRQTGEQRTTRIVQPHQLGGLVERFTSGIIDGFAQQLIAADAVNPHQHGVTTGD